MDDNLLPGPLTAGQVRTFIDFDGGGAGAGTQARTQSEGVAALWHLLRSKGYGYLADEVGMGKTRQAMALISLQLLEDPNAQVVIVCPGKTLQEQWVREWDAFTRNCYLAMDDRLRSARTGRSVSSIALHGSLAEFALSLQRGDRRIHLLRYSSFSRPLWFGFPGEAGYQPDAMFAIYAEALAPLGAEPSMDDRAALAKAQTSKEETAAEKFGTVLQAHYSARLGQLLCARGIALAVFDEAQYLRHVGNQQNRHILGVFHPHARRWLFLSATPLHSGTQSLACLDTYLGPAPAGACSCSQVIQMPRIARRLRPGTPETQDVVEIMQEFMVRRIRTYEDAEGNPYPKTKYRRYERVRIDGAADPFMTLTMALVQKRLVHALDGKNNRFRQGECSSFESLATSVRAHGNRAGKKPEFEHREDGGAAQTDEAIDRASIDALTASFNAASVHLASAGADGKPAPRSLPHAKLSEVVRQLAERSLKDGSTHKSLVFVRRVATVVELRDALLHEFQKEVDARLGVWREWLLATPAGVQLRERPWRDGRFWSTPAHKEDDGPIEPEDRDDNDDGNSEIAPVQLSLDYFQAIQDKGKLNSFQARLRERSLARNPFRGFLQARPEDSLPQDDAAWAAADGWWERFLALCGNESAQAWSAADPWKLATLKRCLLQSMRQTDLLVDLYVLRRYVDKVDGQPQQLPELLLRFLAGGLGPSSLAAYAANWRERFRSWVVHFDAIADKCLRGENATEWRQLYDKANAAFDRMQPVFGRSGDLEDRNAVLQFKFPTHPNVLVCTDVLKEGVDLHLFCDEVVHYGVAWTSGDLEQRVGRVDRFGSQISRRLAGWRPSASPRTAPRLQVEFPYLDGTLDAPQVARVILAKVRSDLRMDMKRHHEDMGKVSLEDLLNPITDAAPMETAPMRAVFFPDAGLPRDAECLQPQPPERVASLLAGCPRDLGDAVHFPRLGVLRRRFASPPDPHPVHPLLRTVAVPKRRNRYTSQVEWLEAEASASPADDLPDALLAAVPVNVETLSGDHDFHFDENWNTLACAAPVDQPLAPIRHGTQTVLLERVTGFWLLRAPLFPADAAHDEAWLAKQSRTLDWAWLARADGVVWMLQFVAQEAADGALLGRLARRMGALTGCLRTSLNLAAVTPCSYRSRIALPMFFKKDGEAPMDDEQWQQAGRFMGNLQAWFRSAFEEVLELLGEEAAQPVMSLRPDGVLHLATTESGRVRLQAFLSGPWIVWELIATTRTAGRSPTLKATPWEYMPHLSMEGWSAQEEEDEDCKVYFCADDALRWAAIYHRPQAWDRHRTALRNAWRDALGNMLGQNFQKKALRQAFCKAAKDR